MLSVGLRQLFKRGRLYERESVFGVTICYEIDGILKMERYFRPDERSDLYDFIFDTFRTYEYHGQQMSARKISLLLGVHHSKIDDILAKAKITMRNEIESKTKSSAKNENLTILL